MQPPSQAPRDRAACSNCTFQMGGIHGAPGQRLPAGPAKRLSLPGGDRDSAGLSRPLGPGQPPPAPTASHGALPGAGLGKWQKTQCPSRMADPSVRKMEVLWGLIRVSSVTCLGSVPRSRIWGALLSSSLPQSVCECRPGRLPEKGLFHRLHAQRRSFPGTERGLVPEAQPSPRLPDTSSAGQMKVILCALGGWATECVQGGLEAEIIIMRTRLRLGFSWRPTPLTPSAPFQPTPHPQ